jgi:hypothetical protein
MIKTGDKLIAKPKYLLENEIPYENRFFTVIWRDGIVGKIQNNNGFTYDGCIDWSNFYLPTNVNLEILKLIESDISIKEFNAVTEDGKVINFRCV